MAKTTGQCPHCLKNITIDIDYIMDCSGDFDFFEGTQEIPTQCPKCKKWFYTNITTKVSLQIGSAKNDPIDLKVVSPLDFNEIFKYKEK